MGVLDKTKALIGTTIALAVGFLMLWIWKEFFAAGSWTEVGIQAGGILSGLLDILKGLFSRIPHGSGS